MEDVLSAMSLGNKQRQFTRMLVKLLNKIHDRIDDVSSETKEILKLLVWGK